MIRRGLERGPEQNARHLARKALRAKAPDVPDVVASLRDGGPIEGTRTVVVVGAGMAGLCAAYELKQLGFTVVVLEADPQHIGGRVRTLRIDGRYGEAGAMRIPADHDLTRFYARTAGVQLRRFVQANGDALLRVRGVRTRMKDVKPVVSQFALSEQERELGDFGLWNATVRAIVDSLSAEELVDLYRDRPLTPKVRDLDRRSLYSLWAERGLTPAAIQLFASTWNLETSLHVALTEHLREEYEGTWNEDFDEIVGGMDAMPRALAEQLGDVVWNGCPVVEIVQDAGGIQAIYEHAGERRTIHGDWLVCTVPLGVLRRIHIRPALSPLKADAIRRVSYDSSTKVLALARRRFWETDDGIFGGGSVSDGALGSTWYPSDNEERDPALSQAPSILLASYSWGQTARRMTAATAREHVVRELALMHEGLAGEPGLVERTVRWSWDEHPWSVGAYAFYQPGDMSDLHDALVSPEGRLLLAGEHASHTHSWIQGAIASGLRAARIIVDQHRNKGSP